ncbi:hypothetical protein RvY_03044 [Ramazzottius varieornatus]|uniref:Uncharacterized protein n=1 Tax=Ramazzottius varieornatus TaxID=947166 RepID=A0A1D1UWX6_RAMVA|nr:hypothetical protein RvY_03044 [Ramazzottius varieornatus]
MLECNPAIQFVRNVKDILDNEHFFSSKDRNLLILDDLATTIANKLEIFYMRQSSQNVDVIHICQNIFQQGKSMRNLHLNSTYLILFKNARDVSQISTLARQTGRADLSEAYMKVNAEPFQPLIVDMKPDCPDYLRIRSHIFPDEVTRVYVNPNQISVPQECLRS